MKIGFIGAGKVGISLGKYFKNKNIIISGYYNRSIDSLIEASKFVETNSYTDMHSLIEVSDIIFLTVNDSNIENVWKEIEKSITKFNITNKIFIHTSGSLTSRIIKNHANYAYSLHPMFPFSNKFETYKQLDQAVFTIEGDREHLSRVKSIIESLDNKVIEIQHDNKSTYHLANVMASNLVLSLINKSVNYLEECGINKEIAKEALFPLIRNNIDNIEKKNFEDAITGPIERADLLTLIKHNESLKENDKELYRNLSENLLNIASNKNKERNYDEIRKFLRSEIDNEN